MVLSEACLNITFSHGHSRSHKPCQIINLNLGGMDVIFSFHAAFPADMAA